MKTKLDHTDWGEILGTSTINHQWLGFKESIKKIEDEFIPHRLVSNINRHKGKVPLNKESVKKIQKKNTLWKRYMETKEGKYYTEYCRARNQDKPKSSMEIYELQNQESGRCFRPEHKP